MPLNKEQIDQLLAESGITENQVDTLQVGNDRMVVKYWKTDTLGEILMRDGQPTTRYERVIHLPPEWRAVD